MYISFRAKNNYMFKIALAFMIAMLVASCVPTAQKTRSKSDSNLISTPTPTSTPSTIDFGEGSLNFFQHANTKYYTTFNIHSTFNDTLYLRGNEVTQYISEISTTDTQCIVATLSDNTVKKNLVLAAKPKSVINFTTRTKEFFYQIETNKTTNMSFCQKTGLINYLASVAPYSSYTTVYSLADVCTTCNKSAILTDSIKLFTASGTPIESIIMRALRFNILTTPESGNLNLSCTSSAQCNPLGYDCCVLGQCVNDKQVLTGIDQENDNDFLQALEDVTANPSRYLDYPQYFHYCPIQPSITPTPIVTVDPESEASARLIHMRDLYECTTQIDGEMSICTKTFPIDVDADATGTYFTSPDDKSFRDTYSGSSALTDHSIYEIIHAGETLFKEGSISNPGYSITNKNDNLTTATGVYLTHVKSQSATDNNLKIRFKVDGSCEKISTTVAKCSKYYVEGQASNAEVDDHDLNGSWNNKFRIPYYADTSRSIKVEVDEVARLKGSHWNLVIAALSYVEFNTGYEVYDRQVVKVTYYVDLNTYNVMEAKLAALNEIDTLCDCGGLGCTLSPKYEEIHGTSVITDYTCLYPPPPEAEPPLDQTVYLNTKTIPMRYFSTDGTPYDKVDGATPPQEGNTFEYVNKDYLKPSNAPADANVYVGANEIYGSMTSSASSPKPPEVVKIKTNRSYDIYVETGTFSSCYYCGYDYYSYVAKIFPDNFLHKGAGYSPLPSETDRFSTTYRSDDQLFGRACFLPLTMIPWSFVPEADRQTQRLNRLQAQHFLFANGYQRDWYGFDYGSVIGSFDGMNWFSIGNARRITSKSNRLYLAVNAYFADVTSTNTFTVRVTEATWTPGSGPGVESDLESSGAECQQYHVCETDQDCIGQLGWDYACENITGVKAFYPVFDEFGLELPGQIQEKRITSILPGYSGSPLRCVYRGRGAACEPDYENKVSDGGDTDTNPDNYHMTSRLSLNACSPNHYCQPLKTGASYNSKFNTKISRYGKSPAAQNALRSESDYSSYLGAAEEITFGLDANILGRPLNYNPSSPVDTISYNQFNNATYNNRVTALCVPGRNIEGASGANQLQTLNDSVDTTNSGDQIGNIGATKSGNTLADVAEHYLSACPTLDSTGGLFHNYNPSITLSNLAPYAGTQNLSTNLLAAFATIDADAFTLAVDLPPASGTPYPETMKLKTNSCLRAPGATCFTNLDCGSNEYIATWLTNVDPEDSANGLNKYETKFWQEPLVCSQANEPSDADFKLGNNKCCRERGKTITIGNSFTGTAPTDTINYINTTGVPGIDVAINASSRYSRMSTVYEELAGDTLNPLSASVDNECAGGIGNCTDFTDVGFVEQYKTIDAIAKRTCCTGHWIRNFHSDMGGGHLWDQNKRQNIEKGGLMCYNWLPCNPATDDNCTDGYYFSCAQSAALTDNDCKVRSIPDSEAKLIFDFMNTLEVLGIPQIPVKKENSADIICKVNFDGDRGDQAGSYIPEELIDAGPGPNYYPNDADQEEYTDGTDRYYSAGDSSNFNPKMKQIFSPDEFTCCIPSGTDVSQIQGVTANDCCSGYLHNDGRCALKDYTNLTVYYNRYVSSAANTEMDSVFDPATGFVINPSVVEKLAFIQDVCASHTFARGVAHSQLPVDGFEHEDTRPKRFVAKDSIYYQGIDKLYDEGLRWSTDLYCVPAGYTPPAF